MFVFERNEYIESILALLPAYPRDIVAEFFGNRIFAENADIVSREAVAR